MEHAARPERLLERRVLGIVGQFGLFLGVEVIEVAEEFVEPVHGRQEFVAVAQMVLAELAGGVAQRLQQFGDRRVFLLQADGGAGHADLGQAGADRVLAGDEAGAAGGAALLGVVVGEDDPFVRHAVDVGGPVAHHAVAEVADVPDADVVAPEYEDVRLPCLRHLDLLWLTSKFRGPTAHFGRLHGTKQNGKEREDADQNDGDRDRVKRCLAALLCHSGDCRETSAPQVTQRPVVLPNRDDKRQDAAENQRQPQVVRRLRNTGRA